MMEALSTTPQLHPGAGAGAGADRGADAGTEAGAGVDAATGRQLPMDSSERGRQ